MEEEYIIKMDRLELNSLNIITLGPLAHPIRYALLELRDYASRCGNIPILINGAAASDNVQAVIGRETARKSLKDEDLTRLGLTPELGDEGFILAIDRDHRDRPMIIAAGNTNKGTRWAVLELIKSIDITTRPPSLPRSLHLVDKPERKLRGMYAHQHWDYRYPYALRTWSVADWRSYVDLLAYFRLNLLQIWSMAAILPVPLMPADEVFLSKYPPIIDHAHDNHGFEVWIGECANNVCERRDVPPVDARDYFEAETLKDPSDPKQLAQLMDARRQFYEIVNNAHGYWVIDSDPGGWEGSPSKEFVDILEGNRNLIDECTHYGRDAKLIYWMWCGWGNGSREQNWNDTVAEYVRRIKQPRWMTVDWPGHIEAAVNAGITDNLVFYPYGAIEPEPSQPFTHVIPDRLRDCIRRGNQYPQFPGMMGNAQTPLVQFPNIHFLANCAWKRDQVERPTEASVRELARLIFPHKAAEIAEGWLALADPKAKNAREIARHLGDLVCQQALGAPGPVGRKIIPRPELLVEDLHFQLYIHAAGTEFIRLAKDSGRPDSDALVPLREYILRSIAWRHRNGFKRFPGDPVTSEWVKRATDARWADGEMIRKEIADDVRQTIESLYYKKEADFYLSWFGKNFYNKDNAAKGIRWA